MDIRVFKTFIQVAETKHFGHAAENLYITQAAVSARIKQLEEFYSSQLFVRDKKNLKLTPSGEALIAHANLMIEQMEQSKQALAMVSQQKIKFTIAATPNVWDAFFSSRIKESVSIFGHVSLSAEISVREAIQRKLADKSLDVGLLADPIKDDDFISVPIGTFDLSLVGSRATFNTEVDDYILVDWGITFQKEHALYHKVTPSFKTSTAMIALEVILSKGGFAYLPTELITEYVNSSELCLIESPLQIKRPLFMVYRKHNYNEQLIEEFKTLLSKGLL